MSLRRVVLGGLGFLTTLLAGIAVARPSTLLEVQPVASLVERVAGLELGQVLLAASALVGVYVLLSARSGGGERPLAPDETGRQRFETAVENSPETVSADQEALTGGELDATISLAIEDDEASIESIRDRLRTVAVATLREDRVGNPREQVDAGTWTDDRTASAFLAAADGPTHSLLSRIRLWLDPAAERDRRLNATVDAIEQLASGRSQDPDEQMDSDRGGTDRTGPDAEAPRPGGDD